MPFYKKKIKKYMATLQVPINLKTCKRVSLRASMSIEAAVVLPIFIFFIVSIINIFSILSLHRKVYAVSESVCKEASQYMYAKDKVLDKDLGIDKNIAEKVSEIVVRQKTLLKLKNNSLEERMKKLNIECDFLDDEEIIELKIDYYYKLPFTMFGMNKMKQAVSSKRRAYIGKSKRGDGIKADKTGDETVYIGKYSSKYHTNSKCHYLYNDISRVNYEELSSVRNSSGVKYSPCKRCIGNNHFDTVFILPSGTSYHSSKECNAIISYVEKVRKSDVIHKGACSYCGGS